MNFRRRGYSGTTDPEISEREIAHRIPVRRAAAEGMVLLENDGVLPLTEGMPLAVYGGGALFTVKGGTGSGSVNNRQNVNVAEGLKKAGLVITTEEWLADYEKRYRRAEQEWIDFIYANSEPGVFFSLYKTYSENRMQMPRGLPFEKTGTDTALYVISRISGESTDRSAVKGDYYLSDQEQEDLCTLAGLYPRLIVILNTGGILDLSFLDRIPVSAVVLMSQAGMEGGNSLADLLTGRVNPCGGLTDTWAWHYEDYPSSANFSKNNGNLIQEKYTEGIFVGYRYFDSFGVPVRYPFGYGLSYTSFRQEACGTQVSEGKVKQQVRVTNTGKIPGREIVLLFAACPPEKRAKEEKRLVAFGKTKELAAGESAVITLTFDLALLESYHTGRHRYYLASGDYILLYGRNARDCAPAAVLTLEETRILQNLTNICPLLDALREITPSEKIRSARRALLQKEAFQAGVPRLAMDGALISREGEGRMPAPAEEVRRRAQEILQSLTREEKARLVCGQPSAGSGEVIGAAAVHVPGAAGETTCMLETKGVGEMILADGPAGLRIIRHYQENPTDGSIYQMNRYESLQNRFFATEFLHEGAIDHYQFASAIPIGTLLAQTFDPELVETIGDVIGREMKEFGVTLWLAPGMNIHRNPLCGRNFEYYSEDPLVSGIMAAAITRGVQKHPGIGTTIKHFACNNQEENRMGVSSVVSERALREIYLKGFEIAVKTGQPMAIMTSYNRLNSVHTANSYDLCTVAARKEWGFAGIIMTDWLTTNNDHGSSAVKCLQAGNDLTMPGNPSDIQEILDALTGEKDLFLREEDLDACAIRLLEEILQSDVYEGALSWYDHVKTVELMKAE